MIFPIFHVVENTLYGKIVFPFPMINGNFAIIFPLWLFLREAFFFILVELSSPVCSYFRKKDVVQHNIVVSKLFVKSGDIKLYPYLFFPFEAIILPLKYPLYQQDINGKKKKLKRVLENKKRVLVSSMPSFFFK